MRLQAIGPQVFQLLLEVVGGSGLVFLVFRLSLRPLEWGA